MTLQQAHLEIEALYRRHEHRMTAVERVALSSAIGAIYNTRRKIDDLEVQLKFWKHAAEQALDGWNKLEDKYEELLWRVRELLKSEPQDVNSEAWRQLELYEDTREEWAPPQEPTDGRTTVVLTDKSR